MDVSRSVVPRAPSPDSACEQDWTVSSAVSGADDITSDLSETSTSSGSGSISSPGGKVTSGGQKGMAKDRPPALKGAHGQESDVDSGIVACTKYGRRIGSTSSADTESSRESRRKIQYPSETYGRSSKCKSVVCRTSALASGNCSFDVGGGPVKGDHSVLKECNRRPPTPLTVLPDSHHCVRFDEQLQLSEHNIRRSCRKIFATLYAQRFSYPTSSPTASRQQQGHLSTSDLSTDSRPDSGLNKGGRNRSRTVPELELRKQKNALANRNHHGPVPSSAVGGQHRRYSVNNSVNKENTIVRGGQQQRKTVSWNLKNCSTMRPGQKSSSEMNLTHRDVARKGHQEMDVFEKWRMPPENMIKSPICAVRTLSTDSGLGMCRRQGETRAALIQKPNLSESNTCISSQSSSSAHTPVHHPCCCLSHPNNRTLYKSNSCSTLAYSAAQSFLQPTTCSSKCSAAPLQKTSSCSSICRRTTYNEVRNVPVYNDSMIEAYAHVASVVPVEEHNYVQSRENSRCDKGGIRKENIYDTISTPPPAPPPPPPSDKQSSEKVSSPQSQVVKRNMNNNTEVDIPPQCDDLQRTTGRKNVPLPKPSSSDKSLSCKEVENKCVNDVRRRTSENVPRPSTKPPFITGSIARNNYLKPSLKHSSKALSHQNVAQGSTSAADSTNRVGPILSEVEYAVVDKSKKNRYTSLPVLNRISSTSCIPDGEDRDPPVPPKKNLHKSDFSLYRFRSSSPKKSFLERVQGFSRSARNALQKAFSAERIYRPEREERMEAMGQKKLKRSRSLMKGLRVRMSSRQRKHAPPMAEVMPQASSNPEWDEQPSGPNSPTHVRGQLLQLNLDGSQVVELSKPSGKPYGFFVARGRVRNSKGVFVSRMRDQETQKQLAGLLDIGDEILEVEGSNVKEADIMEVNNLMANKNTLLLTVLPYICRKDI